MGLAISKRLANILGGDITVQSQIGKGSTFCFYLDIGSIEKVPMLDHPSEVIAYGDKKGDSKIDISSVHLDGRILLAEDGPDNQKLISLILSKAGADVTIAENGEIAVKKAIEAKSQNADFDLILMDMQMPIMDGYTATRELRNAKYKQPIIALTAHAMVGQEDACLQAGCDGYLTKPIKRHEFVLAIRKWLDKKTVKGNQD